MRRSDVLVTSLVLMTSWHVKGVTVLPEGQSARQEFNPSQLISLLSSLAAQSGGLNFLQQQQGSFQQGSPTQTAPAQFPNTPSSVSQLLGGLQGFADYLPEQTGSGIGQFLQGAGQFFGQKPVPYPGNYGLYPPQQNLGHYPGGIGSYPGGAVQYPGSEDSQGTSLIGALSSIARYDDLKCVPRLLCEVAAGGKPGNTGKQDSIIPFLSRDSLLTLLTVFNFGDTSPLLVFGRAMLLGITAQGRPESCLSAYPTCPRDPEQLVYYLNNHHGGFFQFFNNLQRPSVVRPYYHQGRIQNTPQQDSTASITPPPPNSHQQDIGHFVDLYRPRPTVGGSPNKYTHSTRAEKAFKFPDGDEQADKNDDNPYSYKPLTDVSNHHSASIEATTPTYASPFLDTFLSQNGPFNSNEESSDSTFFVNKRKNKGFAFSSSSSQSEKNEEKYLEKPLLDHKPVHMIFPDRTGTGDLRLDVDDSGKEIIFSASASGSHFFGTLDGGSGGNYTPMNTRQRENRSLRFPSARGENVFSRAIKEGRTVSILSEIPSLEASTQPNVSFKNIDVLENINRTLQRNQRDISFMRFPSGDGANRFFRQPKEPAKESTETDVNKVLFYKQFHNGYDAQDINSHSNQRVGGYFRFPSKEEDSAYFDEEETNDGFMNDAIVDSELGKIYVYQNENERDREINFYDHNKRKNQFFRFESGETNQNHFSDFRKPLFDHATKIKSDSVSDKVTLFKTLENLGLNTLANTKNDQMSTHFMRFPYNEEDMFSPRRQIKRYKDATTNRWREKINSLSENNFKKVPMVFPKTK